MLMLLIKACSHVTSAFAFASRFKEWVLWQQVMVFTQARSHCNGSGISFITLVPFTSQMVIVAPNGGGHIAMTFLRPKLAVAATVWTMLSCLHFQERILKSTRLYFRHSIKSISYSTTRSKLSPTKSFTRLILTIKLSQRKNVSQNQGHEGLYFRTESSF